MSAERAVPVDERPTVPAPASEAERSFEEEIARLGGRWGWAPRSESRMKLAHGNTSHGHTATERGYTREYSTWCAMNQRCTNPNKDTYPRYGGRGIRICDRWMQSFAAFLEDMGPRPDGHSLDRIDVDGDYEPSNCRWSTQKSQMRNMTKNRLLTHKGVTLPMVDWAERAGVTVSALEHRLARGWSVDAALSTGMIRLHKKKEGFSR